MAQVINTNILSLNAQRNLTTSSGALQTSLQRLSSGLRINSAKDDAAGLAISERFTTQIRGINQAIRNSNDGISLAQVAEGALGEVNNNLQRIRELAVQSRNATNSDSDRQALNAEVQQRIAEIDRVATQTEFNGLKLLDGSFSAQIFQVGANAGQTISVDSISNTTVAALGEWQAANEFELDLDFSGQALTGNGTDEFGWDAVNFSVGDQALVIAAGDPNDYGTAGAAREAFAAAVATAIDGLTGFDASETGTSVTVTGTAPFSLTGGITGSGTATGSTETVTGFAGEDVLSAENADRMMAAMDAALTAVNGARAELGAVQNRFESVVANLSSASENLSASRSRILDADFAAETAALTRAQILQQAGISVLAQANLAPQNVLALLR